MRVKGNIDRGGVRACSSCGVCATVCPQGAIEFGLNADGFLRPTIDGDKCTDCGICTAVCFKYLAPADPFVNAFRGKPVYGAWSRDEEIRRVSSSGGVGHELASRFFARGWKVSGCVFDAPGGECRHIIAGDESDLEAIRTSKYLQSRTVEAFSQFRKDEKYLVVGTPCQIYGLRRLIEARGWEENFVLVDFFCHGTPSFNLWRKYEEYLRDRHGVAPPLESVNFRKKSFESKWHSYGVSIRNSEGVTFERSAAAGNDPFYEFFLNNSCLNDSCCECPLRLDHCAADIRIADFWGEKYADDEWGVTLVVVNTERGEAALDSIRERLVIEPCTFSDLENSQSVRFFRPHPKRAIVLEELRGHRPLDGIRRKYFPRRPAIRQCVVAYIRRLDPRKRRLAERKVVRMEK